MEPFYFDDSPTQAPRQSPDANPEPMDWYPLQSTGESVDLQAIEQDWTEPLTEEWYPQVEAISFADRIQVGRLTEEGTDTGRG